MDGGEQKELPSLSVGDSNVSDAVTTVVIDEAISEMDDDGTVYTAFGFLVHWRGQRSAGYRRFQEFRALHGEVRQPVSVA